MRNRGVLGLPWISFELMVSAHFEVLCLQLQALETYDWVTLRLRVGTTTYTTPHYSSFHFIFHYPNITPSSGPNVGTNYFVP